MLTKRISLSRTLLLAALSLILAASASAATTPQPTPTPATPTIEPRALWVSDLHASLPPDTHAQVCLTNEQNCLKGCDGATSCSNQCKVNYQKCMEQGQ